ncbi:GNAT family N-acetyltransferase [Roseateles sp. DAIF2]|uniref:GNAT family N-acetyltransferase n=1 Tax=Roseateles sp. DAIF2 TaxID=2714952 RepID=UPI0018A2CB6A|nr:GNAT family N-acetyltransferase [Roseateles sp. DAIF2]QPF73313.1 GNAT family N-acetyltransferase [Roseateles sp. DAIF2]
MNDKNFEIRPLRPEDRAGWEPLARGYKAFYKTEHDDAVYDATWARLLQGREIRGLAAVREGRVLGIAHFFFHTSIWAGESCYLQDLFVDAQQRGRGVARALIEAVAARAEQGCATRFYWTTHGENATARALYDKLAEFRGMIRYDFALPPQG